MTGATSNNKSDIWRPNIYVFISFNTRVGKFFPKAEKKRGKKWKGKNRSVKNCKKLKKSFKNLLKF